MFRNAFLDPCRPPPFNKYFNSKFVYNSLQFTFLCVQEYLKYHFKWKNWNLVILVKDVHFYCAINI